MSTCVTLAKQGQRDAALAVINSPKDRELLDEIRTNIELILDTEQVLLKDRQARAAELRYVLAALVGLALLVATILSGVLSVSTRNALKGLLALTAELDRESKLRQEAEATLRQAQKMEAVGQLTGGVAHDFNNLLTVIIGNLDTMAPAAKLAGATDPGAARLLVAKLSQAARCGNPRRAKRGAAHASAACLFSPSAARTCRASTLNRLVSGMLEMLRRTLGADVSIETVLGAGLWPTFADRHQLENALLNLALNAKDAMPNGGCLTIETANTYLDAAYVRRFGDVAAGQYVVLCVTDTGGGIPRTFSIGCSSRSSPPSRPAKAQGLASPWCTASSSSRTDICASIARRVRARR